MYNAANNIKTFAVVALATTAISLGSCGGNTDDGAHTLVDSIHRCIAIGNYEHAYALMDSLNTRYPAARGGHGYPMAHSNHTCLVQGPDISVHKRRIR